MTMSTRQSPKKPWQQTQKGQVLLIFALTALVLFAIMGLAVDAGISYFHSDEQEKAAAAAALSGVSYLPGDTSDAETEARNTAQRDGYLAGGSGSSLVTITPTTPVAGNANELQVSITAPAPVYFLELLGFGTHEVTATALAEYLPPIQLGAPAGNQLGNNGYYFLRSEGWGNPRSEGDPFTPTPDESANTCGPTKAGTCNATAAPDVHQISCIDGDDLCDGDANGSTHTDCGTANNMCLNDTGGQNYLIFVPEGTTASVNVYNPSFDPGDDTDCGSQTTSCLGTLHEDDGSFPGLTDISDSNAPATVFDSMGYTLFAVPDLNNRSDDLPLEQDIFCPLNAWDLDTGTKSEYSYYEEGTSGAACNPVDSSHGATYQTANAVPTVYNAPPAGKAADGNTYTPISSASNPGWIPLTSYLPTLTNATLWNQTYSALSAQSGTYTTKVGSSYYLYGGSSGQYFRLRVDTLAWNGTAINTSDSTNSPGGVDSGALPDNYPLGHNAYALQVTTPAGASGNNCVTGTACTVSAMADMTFYTPVDGATASNFDVPLFSLPGEYAGKTITVSAFDPGDVGGGAAYIGILQPSYTNGATFYRVEYATLATGTGGQPAVADVGTTLASGTSAAITPNDGTNPDGYPYSADSAVVQTAQASGGTAIYNGNWVQFTIQVPATYNPGSGTGSYWNLYYQVDATAYAGDTLAVEVQYLGSPIHLLPTP